MTRDQLVALALGALIVFWSLGAYNRLLALRNAVGAAWGKVDEARRQRAEAAEPLLAALLEPLAAESGAIQALQAQLAESARVAALLGARPVVAAPAAAWVAVEAAVAAAAARVFALVETGGALGELPALAAGTAAWREAEARLAFARQLFNEAGDVYNAAIAQFPTRLLLPLFRFGRAGRL
ncbi:MAG: LemA family protein [Burkholderiales bacterium]|nr:LemA family protein [Burkholderiales bacterium]